jgi:hypothetical protein
VSWTRTRATARYLNLVTQLSDFIGVICPTIPPGKRDTGQVLPLIMVIPYHNKWKYLACVPFPRWDGGANDADEIRKLCLFAPGKRDTGQVLPLIMVIPY